MILQALYELAHSERLMADSDYEPKPVAWLVRVDDGGKLVGIVGTHYSPPAEEGKRPPKPRPKSFPVPRQEGRTSGDLAYFLTDKAEYALGLDPAGKRPAEKLAKRFALFRERVAECVAATDDPGVRAVHDALTRLAGGELEVKLPDDCAGNDLFAFVYEPDVDRLVTDREAVREYWHSVREEQRSSGEERCLVSGALCSPTAKHPPVKNVPGGTTSGVALVSFNTNAFESYGWSRNDNAPISQEASEAWSTALNRLLHPAFPDPTEPGATLPSRRLRLSTDTVVCYWTPRPREDDFVASLAGLLEADPAQVEEMYQSVWTGHWRPLDDPTRFYALTLSGTQGRAIVRDWFESSVAEVGESLAHHFADLDLVRNTPPPKGKSHPPAHTVRTLVRSLAFAGDEKRIPPALAGRFVSAALRGTAYPLQLLQRAIERTRAEIGRDGWSDHDRRDARAALIKAVLNRRRRLNQSTTPYPEVKKEMDPHNTQDGYLLGRLMAVIERMQQTALRDVNASVVDRYFSAASATPRAVFPRLLRNFRHHARKAKDDSDSKISGRARWLEKRADRILAGLNDKTRQAFDRWLEGGQGKLALPQDAFPAHLPLEQQGLFILGYHHQRHWFFLGKQERARWAEENAVPISETDEQDLPLAPEA